MPLVRRTAAFGLGFALLFLAGAARAADEVTVERDVPYARPDGVTLHLDAYTPAQADGPLPSVLMIHGGSWRGGSKGRLRTHAARLAEAGFAVFAIQYRLAPKHKWPAQIHDCKAAVRWVRSQADSRGLDPQRIGAYGYSAGGHLATLLALTGPDDKLDGPDTNPALSARVQAAVAGGAPCDFTWMPRRLDILGYWLGHTRAKAPEVYREASPLSYIREDAPPLLFFHGRWDALVNPRMGPLRTVQRLRKAGVDATLRWIPRTGHSGAARHPQSYDLTVDFMRLHLGEPQSPPQGP